MKIGKLLGVALVGVISLQVLAEDWPQWRGPHFNGSSKETGLPSKWNKESALWAADMPGASAATPIIKGDLVFAPTTDERSKTLHTLALDRKTGKVLWNHEIGIGIRRSHDNRGTYASPSPVAADDRVFFFFGSGPLIAYDLKGKELWKRDITKDYGDFAFQWTFSSSPLLHDGTLYLQVLQRDQAIHGVQGGESFILALDPKTGKTLWRHLRPSDAKAESLEAFSTPIPHEYQGRKEILVAGGDAISGHDPKTGKEFWRWGTWNPNRIGHWRLVPSPVAGAGVILACAPKGDPVYAVKAGLKGSHEDSAALAWVSREAREISSDVSTPLFYKDDFFILNSDRRILSRVEPRTGEIKWSTDLPGRMKYEASPTGADGKIYTMNFAGDVVVLDAEKGEVISNNAMGEPRDDFTRSTVAVANGQLFIRTNQKLFCIGK